jgi:hypothetical protein
MMRRVLLVLLALALLVLHQDFWNWAEYKPLAFGFLPIGLTYHAIFCVACSILMWLLVTFLWPKHLEEIEKEPDARKDMGGGH